MKEGQNDTFTYEYLNENVYNKMKTKIITDALKLEFNVLINWLNDPKTLDSIIKEGKKDVNFIEPEEKIEFIENKNFIKNKKNYITKNFPFYDCFITLKEIPNEPKGQKCLFKSGKLFSRLYENYFISIFRYIKINDFGDDFIINNSKNNFIDIVISLYNNVEDNSSLVIHKLCSNLSDNIFDTFSNVIKNLFTNVKKYLNLNLPKFSCYESIVIHKNVSQIGQYILSCKIFYNEKYKFTQIKKKGEIIEVLMEVKDSIYPGSLTQSKIILRELSDNSCYILVINSTEKIYLKSLLKTLEIKPSIKMFLKMLRKRIEEKL